MSMRNHLRQAGSLAFCALVGLGLAACTTIEGTNALVDPVTFEREVMTNTAQGLGLVERPPAKAPIKTPRGPLVLPKDNSSLPAPRDLAALEDQLPEDSDTVQIDSTGMTEEDIKRLRNARVFDGRTLSGRPLTEEETRRLTARMTAARIQAGTADRPLWLPPDEYFTTVAGRDLVCLTANGDLVPLDDPKCPPAIRAQLAQSQ